VSRGADPIRNLIRQLSRLPGIGERTAQRLTYFILGQPAELAQSLSAAIDEVRARIKLCSSCFNLSEQDPCPICSDPGRDGSLLCVVERPTDLEAIERTGKYNGRYHVLQGRLSPLDGVTPEDLKIPQLLERVKRDGIREVILATNPNVEGDATAVFLADALKQAKVRVTRIAHGVPVGSEIEYTDAVTLEMALGGRREI